MSDVGYGDFEFERRFLVTQPPSALLNEPIPTLIVQSYLLASDGYALRLRVQSSSVTAPMDATTDPLAVLEEHAGDFDFCALTAKGPGVGGTRYEAERELDVSMGIEMIRRGGARIVKNRYSIWLGNDGWVVDIFGGANYPLIIAECERGGPVTDLEIPDFCVTEVTDQHQFSNDALSSTPYSQWQQSYLDDLEVTGPRFVQDLGTNIALPGLPG